MTVGLSLGADRWRLIRRGVAWTPAALFAAGEQGVFVDPTDGSYVFSDTAGTSAAPVDGAAARLDVPPSSPVAASFTNATAAQQPLRRADGLEFDGVDDRLLAPDIPELRFGTTNFTIAFACTPATLPDSTGIWSKRGGGAPGSIPGWGLRQQGADLILEFDPSAVAIFTVAAGAFSEGVPQYGLVEINRTAGTATARVGGVDSAPVAIPAGDISGTQPLIIGGAPPSQRCFDGTIGRLLAIDKLLSPEDKALVEQWLQGGGA